MKKNNRESKLSFDAQVFPVEIEKSPNDRRKYRAIKLENDIKCLLCCDAYNGEGEQAPDPKKTVNEHDDKLAAAALCVGVGSFCDPEEIPGLAHFMEHMVFMGSEKYPEENAFDVFIKRNGGSTNAHTEYEHTTFFFDVMPNKFREALDRFSQFFISPLFREQSIDREIEAIDNEFQMALPSERCRKEQLFCLMANKNHPVKKFMWGNHKTLRDNPISKGINVHKVLKEFHSNYYSAGHITVCIQAKYSLDVLQKWAIECFSSIPTNNKPKPIFYHLPAPYNTSEFRKLYKYVPAKNVHMLEVTWALPCMIEHYKSKPLYYISWLIGHEGEGSLISYLKKKLWATGISTWGGSYGAWEHNSTGAIFYVTISLTEEGLTHMHGVMLALFSYISMLKNQGPSIDIFKQIKTIQQNEFNLQDDGDPCEHVEILSEAMQYYPLKDIITGDQLMRTYNPDIIKKCINMLTPQDCNICLGSRTFSSICDLTEIWCGTKYTTGQIGQDIKEKWLNVKPHKDFHFPDKNPFIATDFRIRVPDSPNSPLPILISKTNFSSSYYKKDNLYLMPKGYIMIMIRSPIVGDTGKNMALLDLWMLILNDVLGEKAYGATAAQLAFSVNATFSGIEIKLRGFNHQLPLLFQLIINTIDNLQDHIDENLFNAKKEQLLRSYYNFFFKPSKLNNDVRLSILQDPFISCVWRRQILPKLNLKDLVIFQKNYFDQVYFELLFVGNLRAAEAKDMESYIRKKLAKSKSFDPKDRVYQKVCAIPNGETFCRALNFNREDQNCVITNYYQHGPSNLKESVTNELLVNCMEEPCFDILRTREQLGYQVFVTDRVTSGILGFSVTVNSMATKFDMAKLDQKIEMFMKEVVKLLSKMSPKEFKNQVSSLVTVKRINEDSHMGEESERYWAEIVTGAFKFDRLERELETMQKLNLNDIISWLTDHVLPQGTRRKKLSIQVTQKTDSKDETRPFHIYQNKLVNGVKIVTEALKMRRTEQPDNHDRNRSESKGKNASSTKNSLGSSHRSADTGPKTEHLISSEESDNYNKNKVYELTFLPVQEVNQNSVIMNIQTFKEKMSLYPVSKIV